MSRNIFSLVLVRSPLGPCEMKGRQLHCGSHIAKFFRWLSISLCIVIAVPSAVSANIVSLASPGGDETVDGGLRIVVDAYGGFGGSAFPADNAWFNPAGSTNSAGTTYESSVFFRGSDAATFLSQGDIGGSGNLPSVSFGEINANRADSAFAISNLSFTLSQSVQDRFNSGGQKVGSRLVQDYQITNIGDSTTAFSLTRYVDGDLDFDGTISDSGGASTTASVMDQQLFQFDSGDNPSNPTTYFGIRANGGTVPSLAFEIDSFSGLRDRIISGIALDNSIAGDGGDANLITDSPYDISMALQRNFSIAAGQSARYVTSTDFGQGIAGQQEIDPLEIEGELVTGRIGNQWDFAGYTADFTETNELQATLRVRLNPASGITSRDLGILQESWEEAVESRWSNQYEVVDGIHSYPIVVDLEWTDSSGEGVYEVDVNVGAGRANAETLFHTSNAGTVAHEAGHWLGLGDEYLVADFNGSSNTNDWDPAFWSLYNDPDAIDPEWETNALFNTFLGFRTGTRDDWEDIVGLELVNGVSNEYTSLVDQTGIMAANGGAPLERNFLELLRWLRDASGRPDLSLAQAPTYVPGNPTGPVMDGLPPVPEPTAIITAVIGLLMSLSRRIR